MTTPTSSHQAHLQASVLERSDELATRRLNRESLRDDKKDADDPLADLPFWLKDFTDNLEPTEVHATRTHFAGLRFGTSYERGTKIEEAKHLYSLPERPKIATSA